MNNQICLDFLEEWRPGGPWVLTAVKLERKDIRTRTFSKSSTGDLLKFLDEYNGKWNLYFHVNPTIDAMQKKAQREDIASLDWLHVDVDPRIGEDVEEEQKRIQEQFNKLPGDLPKPTVLIFSGGGYQAFWKLKEPFPVDGSLERAEEAKRWNLQIEVEFDADNCHNIDRIMRLPGTMNLPDAKKKKKGRKAALAKVIYFAKDRVYDLKQFTPAPQVQSQTLGTGSVSTSTATQVSIGGNIERIGDLDELNEYQIPDRLKIIIAQGHHPDEPKQGDNSRSAWLFDAICNLHRCGVPDETIYSLLTDADWGISESVLDKGRDAHAYVIRQISRAKEEAIDPWLRRFNETYAVIMNIGGKCRIVEEIYDPALKRTRLTRITFEDFRNSWMHEKVSLGNNAQGIPQFVPAGKWWLEQQERRQFRSLVFDPLKETPGYYNLWKGFACEAKSGDCSLFLEHVSQNICGGNPEYLQYLLGWMARAVQQPDTQGEVAVVMRGERGTGKGVFAKHFGRLFGRHYLPLSNPKHLVGSFNAHLRDCVILFADEAFYAGDKQHESILKTLITEDTFTIEGKGVDAELASNFTHLLMASNNDWVVPSGPHERRFFFLDVVNDQRQNYAYFKKINEQMENGGSEALLHYLMNYDLRNYEVRKVPRTKGLDEQSQFSLAPHEQWWLNILLEGRVDAKRDHWEPLVLKEDLLDSWVNYTRRFNINFRMSPVALGRWLKKMDPDLKTSQVRTEVENFNPGNGQVETVIMRPYQYRFSHITQLRKVWDETYGSVEWPEVQTAAEAVTNKQEPF